MWILVIDRSSSMGEPFKGATSFSGRVKATGAATKLDAARAALLEHLAGIGQSSRVVVIAFDTKADTIYDGPACNRATIAAELASMEAGGGTDIAAALDAAGAAAGAAVGERSLRTLLVTDGESEQAPAEAAAQRLADQGAYIDVILVDPTSKSEALARAVSIDGVTTAVVNAEELDHGVAQAGRAQAAEEAAAEVFLSRQDAEAARLAGEKPPAERLAFTAAYAADILPKQWHSLSVYLHLASRQEQVDALVRKAATDAVATARSHKILPREVELTITPRGEGLEFNPASITVQWFEDVQSVDFRYRARETEAGRPVLARVDIAAGELPIAHLGLSVNVHINAGDMPLPTPGVTSAGVFQRIFASYSSRDRWLVEACRAAYWGLGIELVIDKQVLRAGEQWHPALRILIDKSDLFQLFWSHNAAASKPVRDEVLYALGQAAKPQGFIRPVVWELPMPEPIEEIRQYHFTPLDLVAMGVTAPDGAVTPALAAPLASGAAIPVAVVPLHDGLAPSALRQIVDDVQHAVHLLESSTGLRYYPVPTLVVDEHVVASVRMRQTIDSVSREDDAVREIILRLDAVLRGICMDFHLRGFRDMRGFEPAHDQVRFAWLRNSSEVFPALEEVVRPTWYVRSAEVAAMLGLPESRLSLADCVDGLAAVVLARASLLDGRERLSCPLLLQESDIDDTLAKCFSGAGGQLDPSAFGTTLSGPRSAFVAVVKASRRWLRPRLHAWPAATATRAVSRVADLDAVLRVCGWLDRASDTLAAAEGDYRFRCESQVMLKSLGAPKWHRIADELVEHGFAARPKLQQLRDVTGVFLAAVRKELGAIQSGSKAERDCRLRLPQDDWNAIVSDLGNFGLVVEPETTSCALTANSRDVAVTGDYAGFIALFDAASLRIAPLLDDPPIPATREDNLARIITTYGIFTPGAAHETDSVLYRWASDSRLPQALTLPAQDKVLLCTNALARMERDLVSRGESLSDARSLARAFQRSILVHEHFHAVLECGLADGVPMDASGKALMRASAMPLNEALAAWMQWHAVRDNAVAAARVRDYTESGRYPAWPYAGARHIEAQYVEGGMAAVRKLIVQLRTAPQEAQHAFDESIELPRLGSPMGVQSEGLSVGGWRLQRACKEADQRVWHAEHSLSRDCHL